MVDRVRAAPRRQLLASVPLAAAVLAWLLAGPQERAMNGGLNTGPLPYLPDAWSSAYYEVYLAIGNPLGLSTYYFWGKLAFLLYVAGWVGTRGLPTGPSRRSWIGRRLLLAGWLIGLVGDVVGYWAGRGDELTTATSIGFLAVEVPALLLLLVGTFVYGLGSVHDHLPTWPGWVLVATALVALPWSALVVGYLPHGLLMPLLVGLGVALMGTRGWAGAPAGPVESGLGRPGSAGQHPRS